MGAGFLGVLIVGWCAFHAGTFLHYTRAATKNYEDSVLRERLRRRRIDEGYIRASRHRTDR